MEPLRQRKPFSLWSALVVSVLLHAILILISLFLPSMRPETLADDEEQTITFSFAETEEAVEDQRAEDFPPAPVQPAPQAPPPSEPAIEELPAEEAFEEPFEEPPPAEPTETTPDDAAAPFTEPSETRGEDETATPQKRLDTNQALQDFRRAVARSQASPRPPNTANRNVYVPDLSAVPQSGFGVGNLRFESTDYDWADYGRQIYMRIWRAWHNRLWATTDEFEKWKFQTGNWRLNNQNQVVFVIERDGDVTRIRLEGRSLCDPLDASAINALEEVVLPPLPADFPRDQEVVHARFIAIGEISDLRPHLNYMKRAGMF